MSLSTLNATKGTAPDTNPTSSISSRFIEKYGTHIIVGLSVGGQDVMLVRQDSSSKSNDEASHLKNHLDELGDQLLTGAGTFSPHHFKHPKHKGITMIRSKRGGDTSVSSHCEWLPTVPTMADAIHFSFIPITSLLKGVSGKGFLSHAINMRYKPPIADLQYFLDFQVNKIWASFHNDLPLGPATNKAVQTHTLQFNFMGPKLHANPCQVKVGKSPVTGMRLYLEGMKCNRLAIHLQHLSNTPVLLQNKIDDILAWRGSDEVVDHDPYLEPVQWKKFSHICTAPIKYDPQWTNKSNISYIVTGAQLHVKKHDSKAILHLHLLFARVSNRCVVQSSWTQGSSLHSKNQDFFPQLAHRFLAAGRRKSRPWWWIPECIWGVHRCRSQARSC